MSFRVGPQKQRLTGLPALEGACDTGATGMRSHSWQRLREKAEPGEAAAAWLASAAALGFCCRKGRLFILLAGQ